MQPALRNAVADHCRALVAGDPARKLAAAKALAMSAEQCRCSDNFSVRMTVALGDAPGALAALKTLVAGGRPVPPAVCATI